MALWFIWRPGVKDHDSGRADQAVMCWNHILLRAEYSTWVSSSKWANGKDTAGPPEQINLPHMGVMRFLMEKTHNWLLFSLIAPVKFSFKIVSLSKYISNTLFYTSCMWTWLSSGSVREDSLRKALTQESSVKVGPASELPHTVAAPSAGGCGAVRHSLQTTIMMCVRACVCGWVCVWFYLIMV